MRNGVRRETHYQPLKKGRLETPLSQNIMRARIWPPREECVCLSDLGKKKAELEIWIFFQTGSKQYNASGGS